MTIAIVPQTKAELESRMEILHNPEYMCSAERYGEWCRVLTDLQTRETVVTRCKSSDGYGVVCAKILKPSDTVVPLYTQPLSLPLTLPEDMEDARLTVDVVIKKLLKPYRPALWTYGLGTPNTNYQSPGSMCG